MIEARTQVLTSLLVLSGLIMATTLKAQGPPPASPKEVLRENGLSQAGTYFIVESEAPVRQKIANMQPVMLDMEAKFNLWRAALINEDEFQYLTDYRLELQAELQNVDDRLGSMPKNTPIERQAVAQVTAYRQRVVREMNENQIQIELRRKRLVGQAGKEKLERDFDKVREKFLTAIGDLKPLYDKVKEDYEVLSKNKSVMNALRSHSESAKAKYKLGPSDKLTKEAFLVQKYEASYSPETAVKMGKRPKTTFRGTNKPSKGLSDATDSVEAIDKASQSPNRKAVPSRAEQIPEKVYRNAVTKGMDNVAPNAEMKLEAKSPDAKTASEQLVLATGQMKALNFEKNPERNNFKMHAIHGMAILLNELKAGTVTADRIVVLRADIASLQEQSPMDKTNLDALNRAAEYVGEAAKALNAR